MTPRVRCVMCEERRARPLIARASNSSTYTHSEKRPIFCSKRCAANWALIYVRHSYQWCADGKHWYQSSEGYPCVEHNPDEVV